MPLPHINVYSVDQNKFGLYWQASPKSNIKYWNLYGAPSVQLSFIPAVPPPDPNYGPNKGLVLPGLFTKVITGVTNCENSATPGSIYIEIPRSVLGIGPKDVYFFAITSVDYNGNESLLEVDNVHGVQYKDLYFVDEAGFPANYIYANWEWDLWPLMGWDPQRYINVTSLLGRPAREVKIDTVGEDNIWVKFNSIAADPISIRYFGGNYSFDMKRGELVVEKIYIHNPANADATVRIFVAA